MLVFSNAKINLGLYVTSRRPDGYHNLESIFLPVPFLSDVVEMVQSTTFSFEGLSLPQGLDTGDNLVTKAYKLLQQQYGLPPVSIYLAKKIPTGAGLGGGSSNGAFALRLLNDLFGLGLGKDELENAAAQLGSDCPFFIRNLPALVRGRGEHVAPLELPLLQGYWLTIIYPGLHTATESAFKGITPKAAPLNLREWLPLHAPEDWPEVVYNDFEPQFLQRHPHLQDLKDSLYKAEAAYVSLTGSGSAFYAFSKKPLGAEKLFPDYQVWEGQV